MELKRDLIKYIRDKAKSKYQKTDNCYICRSDKNLDFHHFYSLTELLEEYMRKHKLEITTEEQILQLREEFIEKHSKYGSDTPISLAYINNGCMPYSYALAKNLIHTYKKVYVLHIADYHRQ